jgi:succinate dehydrogenase / fumarate reductase, cytochrome b subunit
MAQPQKHLRPLSPHLQIYKPQISSVLSILHRMTGCFLSLGSVLLAYWLYTVAYDEPAYYDLQDVLSSWFGQLVLIGWTAAFYYHLSNGIRHLFWDAGKGFAVDVMTKTGYAVLASASILTAITWIMVWSA